MECAALAVLVFANGDIADPEWVRPYLAQASAIIAADGGALHLMALDHPPDVVIGDMDSLTAAGRAWLQQTGAQLIQYPAAKDETDLELALLLAAKYEEEIWLFGAMGGRLDQMLANILLLAHPGLQGRQVQLIGQFERAWMINDQSEFTGTPGDLISLIPLGGEVRVRSTSGLKWPLRDELLLFGPARGVSNVMTGSVASVSVASGRLLCICTQGSWGR